jgi:site-specific DNA-methyltransferase (adenine-specific)
VYDGVADGYQRPNKSSYTHKTDWYMPPQGRWPANIVHDGSEEVLGCFPETGKSTGGLTPGVGSKTNPSTYAFGDRLGRNAGGLGDTGTAARFFYCAKASKADREGSTHPTMKPTALMRWLVRLITPPGGLVLDPFAGSGSTGKAAVLEGCRFLGIEQDADYAAIAEARIDQASRQEILSL